MDHPLYNTYSDILTLSHNAFNIQMSRRNWEQENNQMQRARRQRCKTKEMLEKEKENPSFKQQSEGTAELWVSWHWERAHEWLWWQMTSAVYYSWAKQNHRTPVQIQRNVCKISLICSSTLKFTYSLPNLLSLKNKIKKIITIYIN